MVGLRFGSSMLYLLRLVSLRLVFGRLFGRWGAVWLGLLCVGLAGLGVGYFFWTKDLEPNKSAVYFTTTILNQYDNIIVSEGDKGGLKSVFRDMGWDHDLAYEEHQIIKEMPEAIVLVDQVDHRKEMFIGILLPVVLHSFKKVMRSREFLLGLDAEHLSLNEVDRTRFENLCKIYRLDQSSCGIESLLSRVDILPISLVLAQAAIESGWGRSRFTQEGNALFGQWTTFNYQGIVPNARDEGKTHKIRYYSNIEASVDSYLRNLNGHPAYETMRKERKRQRKSSGKPNGYLEEGVVWDLLPFLKAYSQRGEKYLETLGQIIRVNRFEYLENRISIAL